MTELSFVIPAYNEERAISPCLKSILEQADIASGRFEIVVVNNASTDRTREVALSFPGVKVVDESKKGIVHARRAGFLASSGELVANVDADTMLTPGWVGEVLKEFSKDKKMVAYSGPFIYYDLNWFIRLCVKIFYGLGFALHLFNHYIFRASGMLQGGNFIVRRSALTAIGGFNPERFEFYGEDTDIAMRLTKAGKVKFSFRLPMFTSGRRLAHEGLLKMGYRYALNHIWTIVFKKPFTKSYTDIRPGK
ncbi:MAG: glycosyltransferase family 2 protein [Candidatus Liptonbacteria bacterium]